MLVCSIHDPAMFNPDLFKQDNSYEGLLSHHLDDVGYCHLLICDQEGALWKPILDSMEQLPSAVAIKLNALINSQRLIYLPRCNKERFLQVGKWLDYPGSAEAAELISHGHVDVLVAATETFDAMSLEKMACDRTCTMYNYHLHKAYQRERLSRGGRPLDELTKSEFLQQIIRPVVYWADNCTILDKMITRVAYGADGNGREGENWPHFKNTIKSIFAEWRKGCHGSDACFRIVSCHNGPYVGGELPLRLAEKLGFEATTGIEICLKSKDAINRINHDRYLVTNQDVCVGIPSGFDLMRDNEKCRITDAYLRQHQQESDAVLTVLDLPDTGKWSSVRKQ
jgi:hypothetical protein